MIDDAVKWNMNAPDAYPSQRKDFRLHLLWQIQFNKFVDTFSPPPSHSYDVDVNSIHFNMDFSNINMNTEKVFKINAQYVFDTKK